MLKIVKSKVYNFDNTKPVQLGEPVKKAPKKPEKEDVPEEPKISKEELERIREEERRRHAEEEARRFNEAVAERCNEIIRGRKAQMDAEYNRLVESGTSNAERLIEDAKAKSRAIFEATDDECAQLKEKARMEGFEAGFEVGKSEAVRECRKYLDSAAALINEINAKKEAYYVANEVELQETVMEMVKKITMEELKTDPKVIERICRNAAKNFRNSDYLKISLCKGEAAKEFVSDKEFVKGLIPFIPEIEIEELEPEDTPEGTIVLDNGSEIIDASIPTQLEFLKEIMKSSGGGNEDEDGGGLPG
ncbi:MAG: hypothetical protein NC078_10460 [Ruminococcus sp.]|nr:hypothetical protein [Ruminococcus sp.]